MIGRAEVLEGLASARSSERLKAVRLLQENPSLLGLLELRSLRNAEPDSFVQVALDAVLEEHLRSGDAPAASARPWIDISEQDDVDGIIAQAIEQVSHVVVHEVRTYLLRAKVAAQNDLGDSYGGSRTEHALERMSGLLATIKRLEEAAGVPRIEEFDLTQAISQEVRHLGFDEAEVALTRDDAVTTYGDWSFLSVAFRNGLMNAIEASTDAAAPVVITWNSSPTEAFIGILDDGTGFSDDEEVLVKPGFTSKNKRTHFGWGLTIARQTMTSCGGHMKLSRKSPSGALFEMQWPTRRDGS